MNNQLSIADICFVCELCQISRERAHSEKLNRLGLALLYNRDILDSKFKHAMRHFDNLCKHSALAIDIDPLMEKLSKITAKSGIK